MAWKHWGGVNPYTWKPNIEHAALVGWWATTFAYLLTWATFEFTKEAKIAFQSEANKPKEVSRTKELIA